MSNQIYDTVVIGAGAAGLKTAIDTARFGFSVLLLEGCRKVGAKILMSGGTRCNVTNETVTEKDFASERPRRVRDILRAYPPQKTVDIFQKLGVRLIREHEGKCFPETNSAGTVLNALLKEIHRLGVELQTEQKISKVSFEDGIFEVTSSRAVFRAKAVVIATGGLSYPGTGSDGSGYGLARQFGHTIIPTIPALTPLKTDDEDFKKISGVAANCRLRLRSGTKEIIHFDGPLLFTHFGFSGPAALNMSRYWLHAHHQTGTALSVSFLPSEHQETFLRELEAVCKKNPKQTVLRHLNTKLPKRLAEVLLLKADIARDQRLAVLKRAARHQLLEVLFRFRLPVCDVYGYRKAEVTAGGVDLKELDTVTLESCKQPGLFLAGEILDADGRIGGFNFQWAWATAHLAAGGIKKYLDAKTFSGKSSRKE